MKHHATSLDIYTEIGFGNQSFISTEIEKGLREKRVRGWVRFRVTGIYVRVWIGYKVFVLSTRDGFKTARKTKRRLKFLFGLSGTA